MITDHLSILLVAVPLLAAPVCILLKHPNIVWAFTTLITWSLFAISILLLIHVLESGTISYHLGGWAPPFGIEYRLDTLNSFMLLIVTAIAAIITPYALKSVAAEISTKRHNLFYSIYLLSITGFLGIISTGDVFNIYVFMEISSLASYVLISLGSSRNATVSAFRYLIIGTIGATFLLIGIGLLYMMTGTLNITDLSERVLTSSDMRPIFAAFAFITVGIFIKLALFPLHVWLPNAYSYAPSIVSAYLAAISTKVSAYLLLRFVFTLFGKDFAFNQIPLMEILVSLSLLAIIMGSSIAAFQNDLKRLFAYSSIGQIGYLGVGIGLASVTGLTGAIVHMFNHAVMKGGIFLAIGYVVYSTGTSDLRTLNGIGRKMPYTTAALVIGGLGLIGIPGTSGFVSKWYLVQAALEADLWPVAIIILLGSLLALIYVGRVIEAAYFRPIPEEYLFQRNAQWQMIVPVWVLISASIYFGIHTEITVHIAENASQTLLGLEP